MTETTTQNRDHVGLTDTFASRRYFRKFEAITAHLARVAGYMQADGALSKSDVRVLTRLSDLAELHILRAFHEISVGRARYGSVLWQSRHGQTRQRFSGGGRAADHGQ